jgi:hypothetical protein
VKQTITKYNIQEMMNNKEINLKLPQPCSGFTTALQQPCRSLPAAALHWFPYGSDPMVAALQFCNLL